MNTHDSLLKQFDAIKIKHPHAIILFRVGDCYKSFREDAQVVANITGTALTDISSYGTEIPFCEFNFHFIDAFLPLLVRSGLKVAICERLESPPKKH